MVAFEFISDERMRLSLEADYRELNAVVGVMAWKAVYVLGGNIVEAILVDYLDTIGYQSRMSKDPLKMTFDMLITAGKAEGILSERSAQLSFVLKDYRNLIHPGRMLRLNEAPDADGAKVVQALVDMVVREVANRKLETYGYTAEQVVAKIERDPSSLAIVSHILGDIKLSELKRLLLRVLPDRFVSTVTGAKMDQPDTSVPIRLRQLFRAVFDKVDDSIKTEVTNNFAEILKRETTGDKVLEYLVYEAAFFRSRDIQYLHPDSVKLVKQHLLSRLLNDVEIGPRDAIGLLEGLAIHLEMTDIVIYVDVLAHIVTHVHQDPEKREAEEISALLPISREYQNLTEDLREAFDSQVDSRRHEYESAGRLSDSEVMKKLAFWTQSLPDSSA